MFNPGVSQYEHLFHFSMFCPLTALQVCFIELQYLATPTLLSSQSYTRNKGIILCKYQICHYGTGKLYSALLEVSGCSMRYSLRKSCRFLVSVVLFLIICGLYFGDNPITLKDVLPRLDFSHLPLSATNSRRKVIHQNILVGLLAHLMGSHLPV